MLDLSARLASRPLYLQVRDLLLGRVTSGEWRPGNSLPNENLLAQQLGVSIGTIRKALDLLEKDHVLVRRQGHGTFVRDYAERPLRFSSIADLAGERVVGEVRVKSVELIRADQLVADRLGILDEGVHRIERVRSHLGRPYVTEISWLPENLYPSLPRDWSTFAISSLAQMNSIIVDYGEEHVQAVTATADDVLDLELPEGTPILKLDRIIFSSRRRPLEWRVSRCDLRNERFVVRYA